MKDPNYHEKVIKHVIFQYLYMDIRREGIWWPNGEYMSSHIDSIIEYISDKGDLISVQGSNILLIINI